MRIELDANHPGTFISSANTHYNAYGQATSLPLGNGVTETAGFDVRGRVQYLNAVNGSNTTVYSLNSSGTPVTYAADSNITAANDSVNGSWSFAYDPLNRISRAAKGGGNTYTYSDVSDGSTIDRYANLWKQYVSGSPAPNNTFSPAGTNQTTGSGVTYDAAGNVQTWYDGSSTHTYTYDAEGRITSIDSGSIQYTYDAIGRRVEKNVSGVKHDYIYNLNGKMVAGMNASGGWEIGEIWAGERHLATYFAGLTYFSHSDWLGTDRVHTTVSGGVDGARTNNPYGDSRSCTGGDGTNIGYAGMDYDAETGFYHTQYRYYNPRLGSWMTPDPAGMAAADTSDPQSLNRYAYVENNPIGASDPLGLSGGSIAGGDPPPCWIAAGPEAWSPCAGPGTPCDFEPGEIESGHFPGSTICIWSPIPWPGGRDNSGGGGGGSASGPPPHGETLGVPSNMPLRPLNACQLSGLCPINSGCSFGVCSTSSYDAGVLIWGAGALCASSIICDVVVVGTGLAIAGVEAWEIYQLSQRGRGNQADTGIEEDARRISPDMFKALAELMEQAKRSGDKAKMQRIKNTQKYYGCRRSR